MNKGILNYPERFRGESFHSFPSKNKTPLFFGFPSGSEIYDFKCDANTANFAFRITLAAEVGARIVIDKGNSESLTVIGTGSNVNVDWIYPQTGQYNINISGETSRITLIAITSKRLIGNLSQSFVDKIPNVQVFNIASNFISGELPSFASCTALTQFYCNSNQFSGTLPSFASCTALTQFYCNSNQFSGTLPSFASCTALTQFYCNSNQFSGTLPSFASCTALIIFYCYINQFSGILPSFASCTALTIFQCYNNQFSGTLPSFASCTALTNFQCSNNQFSGELHSFASCTALTQFYCHINQFSGVLPSFASCTALTNFQCNSNQFSGELPSFASCTALTNFQCNSNQFSGELPSFASCTSLSIFWCFNNQFSGELPSFADKNLLRSLWASGNNFSGTVYLPSSQQNFNDMFRIDSTKDIFSITSIVYNGTVISGQSVINHYDISNANIDEPIPFGTNVICRNILAVNCGIGQLNIDLSIRNLFYGRNNFNLAVSKTLNMAGATNGTPSGAFQQPAGFSHSMTEEQLNTLALTEKEMIWVLINCQISAIDSTKRYNWSIITTN